MTSTGSASIQDGEPFDVKENKTVSTIHRIYRGDDEELVFRDPTNRRSLINRPAYAKLHRSFSATNKRHSVDNLKGRFENIARQNSSEQNQSEVQVTAPVKKEEPKEAEDTIETKFTPATFGYPKTAKLVPPLIKPKPALRKKPPKDENSNVVNRKSESSDAEEIRIVLQPSASEDSVDKIASELSIFTMDGKLKERKRSGNLRKWFGLFGKDKKKKEEERKQNSDNLKNESNFNRQSPLRQTAPVQNGNQTVQRPMRVLTEEERNEQEAHEAKLRELEREYARLHIDRFNQLRETFGVERDDNYVLMDNSKNKTNPPVNDSFSTHVNKYIDTSSSASTDSEKPNFPRETPPRAQETHQEINVVKPKASIPISTQRPLPNPYQNEETSPRTIERNLNKSDSKDYPDKANVTHPEVVYGIVFDSLEYMKAKNGDIKATNSRPPISPPPRPISIEKLKLPPNREIYEPQPRVKSPIPTNRVSTDKIIATELLKNTRSPTPPKRVAGPIAVAKPPMSPKLSKKEPQFDRIVTNAMVHEPRRPETPQNLRASTPVDLRMAVSMKLSPKREDIRKSVEEYYWKELKKLKEEEDYRLYSLQVNGYYDDSARVRRSRSLSPSSHRGGRRNLSLPRESQVSYGDYGRVPPPQPIPEDHAVITNGGQHFVYDQNFVRNNPERRSVDSFQRPIFRRGSLTRQEIYETTPYNKRVSFSNSQATQAWPTRNGYTQNPPQRRLERMNLELEDEVFVQTPTEPIYGTRYSVQNEPVYSNRVLEQFRAQQYENLRRQQYDMGSRRLSMDSLPYTSRPQVVRRPVSNVTNVPLYPSNSQLSLQRNPVYSSRQSITDSNYGQRQVTVRNKYCDMYGQIHDSAQTGVVMGQMVPSQPDGFVRGSRLTASANDIGKRYETNSINYDKRPLPPVPRKAQISDTESASDASEIQRIVHNKTKVKKRGFFGK